MSDTPELEGLYGRGQPHPGTLDMYRLPNGRYCWHEISEWHSVISGEEGEGSAADAAAVIAAFGGRRMP